MNSLISRHVLEILEWDGVLAHLKTRCSSEPGAAEAASIEPLPHDEIKIRMKKISQLKELLLKGESMDFAGITDISALAGRAMKGSALDLQELAVIRRFILASRGIIKFLNGCKAAYPAIGGELVNIDSLKESGDLLLSSITESSELNTEKYPVLKQLGEKIYAARLECEKTMTRLMNGRYMAEILQEKMFTTFNQRHVLPVKTSMKERIKGTVHSISASGATTYIEPDQVRGLNNRFITLQLELQNEVNIILAMLSREIGKDSGRLMENLAAIARLDFLTAAARLSIDYDGCEPGITPVPHLKLMKARHPLLHLMKKGAVVENDIELGIGYNCLIISGANTGGKTVLLKTMGLISLLAAHGLHIPAAPDSSLGIFGRIFADIGDDQNMAMSLSTFSGQIMVINEILSGAGNDSLILIDEIIVGTSPGQGAALARAIIEELMKTECRMAVTTHYSSLKEMAAADPGYMNASVFFNLDTLKPTYELVTGYPGVSYALEIAGLCGLSSGVISRARELISGIEGNTEAMLEEIQRRRQEIEEEKKLTDSMKKDLDTEKAILRKKEDGLNRMIQEIKMERGMEFLDELKEYRKDLAGKMMEIRQAGMKQLGDVQKEIIEIQKDVTGKIKKDIGAVNPGGLSPIDQGDAEPGMKVFVPALEIYGVVESIDASGTMAHIHFGGSYRARFRLNELLSSGPLKKTAGKEKKIIAKNELPVIHNDEIGPAFQTSYNTVDLRGMQVSGALKHMEDSFDRMMRQGISPVVVIHGHGTGALKEAVRENLKMSPYSDGFRPGNQGEGQDGVTIVRLRI